MKIPILAPPYQNTEEQVPPRGGTELINGYFDELGALHKRPGLWPWWAIGILNGTDGLFWWHEKQVMISVAGGRAFAFSGNTAPVEITTVDCRLKLNSPVQFASLGAQLFMTNGSRLVRWTGVGDAAYLATADDPTEVVALASFNGRLVVAEPNQSRARFTEYVVPTDTTRPSWSTEDLTPESSNDAVTAVVDHGSELGLYGPTSIEFWQDVGASPNPFARTYYTTDNGTLAPNAIVRRGDQTYWINQQRGVVEMTGRQTRSISLPIQAELNAIQRISDARAFVVHDWLVWTFPHDDVTWVYDTRTQSWAKWGYHDPELLRYKRYRGQCSTYAPEWNIWFVGGLESGRIYLSGTLFQTDAFVPIRLQYKSAHVDHDTHEFKVSKRLTVRMRRGW